MKEYLGAERQTIFISTESFWGANSIVLLAFHQWRNEENLYRNMSAFYTSHNARLKGDGDKRGENLFKEASQSELIRDASKTTLHS